MSPGSIVIPILVRLGGMKPRRASCRDFGRPPESLTEFIFSFCDGEALTGGALVLRWSPVQIGQLWSAIRQTSIRNQG
jgi:hypothetical protein